MRCDDLDTQRLVCVWVLIVSPGVFIVNSHGVIIFKSRRKKTTRRWFASRCRSRVGVVGSPKIALHHLAGPRRKPGSAWVK